MSTNFYWYLGFPARKTVRLPTGEDFDFCVARDDPKIHVGKRSFAGIYCFKCKKKTGAKAICSDCGAEYSRSDDAKGAFLFSWAQNPSKVRALCGELGDKVLLEDEYGETYTGAQFLKLLNEVIEESANLVGARFS